MFILTWIVALSVWRFGHIEERWDRAAARASAPRAPDPAQQATSSEP